MSENLYILNESEILTFIFVHLIGAVFTTFQMIKSWSFVNFLLFKQF